jgi:hypothetical protein
VIRAWPQPLAGDIVWCFFPLDLATIPADKPRPGLILEVYSDRATAYDVLVAYGTSQKVTQLYGGEFVITEQDGAAFRIAGLSYPTKFNLKRRIELPFNETYFDVAPGAPFGQSPKLGTLHPSLMQRVAAAWEVSR